MPKDHKALDLNSLVELEEALLASSELGLGVEAKCSFAKLMDRLGPEATTLTASLLVNKKVSTRAIHLALRKAGAHIGRDTITDHRNNKCICPKVR